LHGVNDKIKKYLQEKMVVGALSADEWTLDSGTSYFGIMLRLIYEKRKEHLILLDAHLKQNGFTAKALAALVCNALDV
jgi:hypothetical protein